LIKSRIELFEAAYSRFRADSLVSQIAKEVGEYTMPDDAELLLSTYQDFYTVTNGLFTPFMGQVLVDAGYDATYSLKQTRVLQAPPKWEEVMEYSHPLLQVKKPFLFDFGAAGKGYLIDIVASLIQQQGIKAFCIDAGGDILHRNTAPLEIGLEHPDDTTKVIGVVALHNKSLCGSSGNRRKWQQFHHIINPDSLSSPRNILAVWVIADTTLLADAIATCLFFVQPELLHQYTFEYLILHEDYSIEKSTGFAADLY
jgi:thiamine biosynthesis lipoprotein